ncbi:MAG: DUF6335 family protein [Anaerolineales bacterium]
MMKKNKLPKQTVDPYTGEAKAPVEDGDKVIELVPLDNGERDGRDYLLEEESSMDALAADEDADAVAQRAARYTQDEEIKEDFKERQQRAVSGREALEKELEEYHAESPELSGGDLDAAWQSANSAGEETVGGTTPTPDQDVVDELGQAVGITYEADEPLSGEEKLLERDRQRWELDPESVESTEQNESVVDGE